jgi:F-type H+-transporting ATPase subunit a
VTGDVQVVAAPAGGCHIFSGCGYPAPSLDSFNFRPLFTVGSFGFTKPMLIAVLSAIVVIGFFWVAFAKPKLVPRGVQNIGEIGILAVRDQILRPSLGKRGDVYLPFLVSLFFYIWLMNLMELIPVLQFPAMSRIGFVWPLVAMVYLLYLYLGFKHQGFPGYIKNMIPWDVPKPVLVILIPIELARFFIVQPFTLGVRLFANMFAGHLLLVPGQPVHRAPLRGRLVHDGVFRLPARVADRPAAGVHFHHPDRRLHRELARVRALTRCMYDLSGGTNRRYEM